MSLLPPPSHQLISLSLTVLMFTLSCTTITLEEKHAFDTRRTVSHELLSELGLTRTALKVPTAPNTHISSWYLKKASSRGVLLYFGGNGYLMVHGYYILQGITGGPADVFTIDYRGYGESDGEAGVAATKEDALAVYDYLIKEYNLTPDKIIVHGQSLGSLVATWVASQRPVGGLILETPLTTIDTLLSHLVPWWAQAFIRFDVAPVLKAEDSLERIRNYTGPLLIIAGENDVVTNPKMAKTLYEASPSVDKALHILPRGDHNDLPPRTDYIHLHRSFVERVLPSTNS